MNATTTFQPLQFLFKHFICLTSGCFCFLVLAVFSSSLAAQTENLESASNVKIGLGGVVKLGKWAPIFIDSRTEVAPTSFEVSVIDGDDTPVVYSGTLLSDQGKPNQYQACVRIGRTYGDIVLRLFDGNHVLVEELELETVGGNRNGEFRRSTQPMILTLEPDNVCRRAIESMSVSFSEEKKRVVIAEDSTDELPTSWMGYDGVEAIVLVTSDLERVKQLSSKQLDAIDGWVKNGGTLVLSAASSGRELLTRGGSLERFCPGDYLGVGGSDGTRIEAFAESLDQLISKGDQPIEISRLENIQGKSVVDDSKNQPLVIRQARGLGQIVFVAFDLDSKRIVEWSGYGNLVNRLFAGSDRREDEQQSQQSARGGSVSHYGYEDIIGQLRVPLDAFSNVKFVAFATVAVLVGLYILCIGPGDYFFLRKLTGKMELTWITFPLLSLLFCGLAIWISSLTRPNSNQLNQLEIIDIDTIEGRTRGSVWTNLYSPSGGNCSIEFDPSHSLGFAMDSDVLSWHGLPGDGLGGMLSSASPGLLKIGYQQPFVAFGQRPKTKIVDLPLQVSSTKPMFGQWWSDNPVQVRSRLRQNAKLQQITGSVTNPFDFTLHNCRLLFENWAYVLEQPLGPGDTFDIVTETTEKNLRSFLTRRAKYSDEKKRSDNSPWDPTDTRVSRIADVMMFYGAAGGDSYTGLTNGYQSFVDMTELLNLNRAVLVGEVQSQGAAFKINGENVSGQYDQTVTIVRVVLPVE